MTSTPAYSSLNSPDRAQGCLELPPPDKPFGHRLGLLLRRVVGLRLQDHPAPVGLDAEEFIIVSQGFSVSIVDRVIMFDEAVDGLHVRIVHAPALRPYFSPSGIQYPTRRWVKM